MWRRVAAQGAAFAVVVAVALAALTTPAGAATLATPTNVTATAYPAGATVYFDAPSPPSGTFYTYTATASPGGEVGQVDTNGPSPGQVSVGNLTNGQSYTFTVVVSDGSGDSSAPSAPSNVVTPKLTVPDALVAVSATATDGQATVSFQGDGMDGGTQITKFTATASPGGAHASGADSPLTVTGLNDGTAYTFTVTATNAVGNSPQSTPSAPVTPLAPPSATTAPVITGDAQVGQTVQASNGVWNEPTTGFTYQWYDCAPADASKCSAITGATGAQYGVTPQDEGSTLEAKVTAINPDEEPGTATSAPTSTVPLAAPAVTTAPVITGTAQVDNTLSASQGAWDGVPDAFSYQWLDCDPATNSCFAIAGATDSSYVVDPLDGGFQLAVQVTATNADQESGVAQSASTETVTAALGAPTLLTGPVMGAEVLTQTVTATPGIWANDPTSLAYQWFSCTIDLSSCDAVGGDALSYTPAPSDLNHVLLLEVVATNAIGDSVAALSEPSNSVGSFPPPTVSITTPADGSVLTSETPIVANYSCTAGPGTTIESCYGGYYPSAGAALLPVPSGTAFATPPGAYEFMVTATQSDGQIHSVSTNFGVETAQSPPFPYTPPPPYTPLPSFPLVPFMRVSPIVPPPPFVSVAPFTVSTVVQSATRWRIGTTLPRDTTGTPAYGESGRIGVGTSFSFTTSDTATVTFAFSKRVTGRTRGKRCVAGGATTHGKSCALLIGAGSFRVSAAAGANVVAFAGLLSRGKRLTPGSYVAKVSANSGTGDTATTGSAAGRLSFTIVK